MDDDICATLSGTKEQLCLLSMELSDDQIVVWALYAVIIYTLAVIAAYLFTIWIEYRHQREIRETIRQSGPSEALIKTGILTGAKLPKSYGMDSSHGVARHDWGKMKGGRIGDALLKLIGAYLYTKPEDQVVQGLRPSNSFLLENDKGSSVNIVALYDVLIRMVLIVTFAGVAAVLLLSGLALQNSRHSDVRTIACQNLLEYDPEKYEEECSGVSNSSLVDSINNIIALSATKFWITVFGLLGAVSMFIVFLFVEKVFIKKWFRKLSVEFDKVLDSSESMQLIEIVDSNMYGLRKESDRIMEKMSENIDNMGKLSEGIEDIVESMKQLVSYNQKNLESVTEKMHVEFANMQEKGISIFLHERFAQQIQRLLDGVIDHVEDTTNENKEIKEEIEKFVEKIESQSREFMNMHEEKMMMIIEQIKEEDKELNGEYVEEIIEKTIEKMSDIHIELQTINERISQQANDNSMEM